MSLVDSISRSLLREVLKDRPKVSHYPAFILRTPEPDVFPGETGRMRRELQPWQVDGFKALGRVRLRALTAPTGSGKTTLAVALSMKDILAGMKVIISYPKHEIAPGFKPMRIKLPGGRFENWVPTVLDDDSSMSSKIQAICDFVLSPPSKDLNKRALLCTHQALAVAHRKMTNVGGDPWKGTAVVLDECHHVAFDEGHGTVVSYEMNGLARLVAHYVHHSSGPLTLVTATWMRMESKILPISVFDGFTKFDFPIDEYLKTRRYLRELQIRFVVGERMSALRSLVEADPNRKTIVYLQSGITTAAKLQMLGEARRVIEEHVPTTQILDLVVPRGRHRREEVFFNTIGKQVEAKNAGLPIPGGTPTVVCSLNKFCEGADWPEVSRSILLSPRGSVGMTLQILGRLLRDWPGKDKVEVDIIVPVDPEGERPEPEKILAYLKVMLFSMVVDWQFRKQEILNLIPRGSAGDRVRPIIDDPKVMRRVLGLVVKKAVEHGGDQDAWGEAEKEIIDDLAKSRSFSAVGKKGGVEFTDMEREVLKKVIRFPFDRLNKVLVDVEDLDFTPEIRSTCIDIENPFGIVAYWAVVTGTTLREIRESLGKPTAWTMKLARAAVMKYRAANGGAWPTQETKGLISGTTVGWMNLNRWLRSKGSSLSRLCIEMGKAARAAPVAWTLKLARATIMKYRAANGGTWPTQATKGTTVRWTSLDSWLWSKGSSLSKFCIEMGKAAPVVWTMKLVRAAVMKYRAANGDAWPMAHTKSLVPGVMVTWGAFDRWLRSKGSTLSRLCIEMGKAAPVAWTLKLARAAVMKYRAANGGAWPTEKKAKGLVPGTTATWVALVQSLRSKGWSFFRLCIEMGRAASVAWTMKLARATVMKYRAANGGAWPTRETKGLVPGTTATWSVLNRWLYSKGLSLSRFCIEMGKARR